MIVIRWQQPSLYYLDSGECCRFPCLLCRLHTQLHQNLLPSDSHETSNVTHHHKSHHILPRFPSSQTHNQLQIQYIKRWLSKCWFCYMFGFVGLENYVVPGQSWLLQEITCSSSPHGSPPSLSILMTFLSLSCSPPPHTSEHCPQSDHSVVSQSTI